MRRLAAALLGVALASLAAAQQPAPDVATALRPYEDFRSHTFRGWHPEGKEILVGRRAGGAEQLNRVEAAGATLKPVEPAANALLVAYHPKQGGILVFIAETAEGSRRVQRLDVATGEVSAVSPAGEEAMEFAWSPEGDRIVYATLSEDPGSASRTRTTLRLVDPGRPATERLLGHLEGRWKEVRFSPNGRRLALTQEVSPTESHVWIMDVGTTTRRRVTRPEPRARGSYRSPSFTRDGNSLFALSDRGSEHWRLVLLPLTGGAPRVLTGHLNYDVDAYAASIDAGLLAFVTNENGGHVMRFIDLVTLKEQPRPSLFDGVIGGLAWKPKSREIGYHVSSARSAGDVFSYDAKANQVTRWTNGNGPGVNTRDFVEPRLVKWKAADGRESTGLLYMPPPERFPGKRPVIVDHRAGPGSQWRAGFLGRANYVVGELGVAILRPNVRGSSGSGKAHAAAGEGAKRDDHVKDIAALIEWIGRQPLLDDSRTLVIGTGIAGQPNDDGFIAAAVDYARRITPR